MAVNRKVLAVGLLVLAGIMTFVMNNILTPPTPAPVVVRKAAPAPVVEERIKYVDILVAKRDIRFGQRIGLKDLEWTDWPEDSLNSQHITITDHPNAIEERVGSVAQSAIFEGETINDRKLVKTGERSVMAALLSPGMRAVTTRISVASAAGGFITPGDHVDIILTRSVDNINGEGENSIAETIFENVRVMAIDQTFQSGAEGSATLIGSTATFELNQQDAEYLQEVAAQGDLTLTLRSLHNSDGRPVRSAARIDRDKDTASSLVVIRRGTSQKVGLNDR